MIQRTRMIFSRYMATLDRQCDIPSDTKIIDIINFITTQVGM